MSEISVKTQAELDKAIADNVGDIYLEGDGRFVISVTRRFYVRGASKPHVEARESSQPHVEAWESSQPHVEAWGSSQPHVVARESSQPHVEARGSSQPHVVARGSSQPHVVARESSQPHVEAWESSQPHVVAWESSQPHVVAWGSSQPHVVAWGSSQPHVEARESSQPHVVARESSQPHVVARESSQPHVEARGSSQPHVEATGYTQLSLFGAVKGTASKDVAVLLDGEGAKIKGGRQTKRKPVKTAEQWCDYYGVPVVKGVVVLFKAVRENYFSARGGDYTPGSVPKASDWDGGKQECGGGFHFVPHPAMGLDFDGSATKFVACPIRLKDIAVHYPANYPNKIKAPGCCAPCWEVDRTGKKVDTKPAVKA